MKRAQIIERIEEYERAKKFNIDVEDDPETFTLLPDKIDYLGKKLSTRFLTRIANSIAVMYYEGQIRKGNMIIKEIKGIENFKSIEGGAIITCNHFSVYDNYAVYRAIKDYLPKGHQLYKVIREGNYTNYKGLYGFFFKHCNTLPLSSNTNTMKKFLQSVSTLLMNNEKILIYPEQAMWWNYRKPRPLQTGAFNLAVSNSVPIIPVFITMEDTDRLDNEGYKVQAYTLWFLPPIYQKDHLSRKENIEYMKNENFRLWKEKYEEVYGVKLKYAKE